MGKGFCKTAQGARDDPKPGVLPMRQPACGDIAQGTLGDHRIGLGEHRAVGQKLLLTGVAALRCVVGSAGHDALLWICFLIRQTPGLGKPWAADSIRPVFLKIAATRGCNVARLGQKIA